MLWYDQSIATFNPSCDMTRNGSKISCAALVAAAVKALGGTASPVLGVAAFALGRPVPVPVPPPQVMEGGRVRSLRPSAWASPPPSVLAAARIGTGTGTGTVLAMSDEWGDFASVDDIDEDDDLYLEYAKEEDTQEQKAAVGSLSEPPEVDWFGDPIEVPVGSELALDEETVQGLLAACREEIGTMFGYSAENRGVGITGGVDLVEMDGPIVVLSLKGRFWHERSTVLSRVGAYLMGRCPEIIDVVVEDEWQVSEEADKAY